MSVIVVALIALALLVGSSWIASAFVRAAALPARSPKRVLALPAPSKRRVAFLGASLTHGKVSADWVSLVGQALDVDVVNAGVNGDLAWNARLRLEDVLATKPSALVVLVGSNDVMAGLDAARERRYMTSKNLPQRPTLAWYRENLIAISERAKSAGVPVLFASLPPLGEDLDSDVNQRVRSANEIIAMVAQETGARFVDVYAPLADVLRAAGAKRAFTGTPGTMFAAILRRYALGWSFDRISANNGYRLLTDGIHANDTAARIIADTIVAALRE